MHVFRKAIEKSLGVHFIVRNKKRQNTTALKMQRSRIRDYQSKIYIPKFCYILIGYFHPFIIVYFK